MKFSHHRLFFALFPRPQVRRQLLRAFQSEEANLPKAVTPGQLHLTLLYLGKVTDTECNNLIRGIDGIQHVRFSLEISRVGWWQTADVAWLAPGEWSGALDSLVADIIGVSRACGLRVSDRRFCPHITVARGLRRPFSCEFSPILWEIRDFCLVASVPRGKAVEYNIIHTWALS